MCDFYNIDELKSYDIRELCYKIGLFKDLNDFEGFCPKHELSGLHNPSLKLNIRANTCRCFKCEKTFDNIDIIKYFYNLDNFKEACAKLQEIINGGEITKATVEKKTTEEQLSYEKEKLDKAIKNSTPIHKMHNKSRYMLDSYLNYRAIKYQKIKELLEENNIEIRHCFYSVIDWEEQQKLKESGKWDEMKFSDKYDNFIMFYDIKNELVIRRNIEDFLSNKTIKHEDRYRNIGNANYTKIDNNSDITIIFESMIDMLSYISNIKKNIIRDYNYISLNSTTNFEKVLKQENMYKTYWIMVDNDEAGDFVVNGFEENKRNYVDFRFKYKDYNDVNDAIKHFRESKKE